MTGSAAEAATFAAARAAQERHLLRQIRGVVGLVLVLAAALAGLSFVPDARHERIERTPPPATTQSSPGGTSPDTAPSPAPSTAKTEDGSPVAATPAAAGSAPESDPISPAATTATGASPVVPAPTPAPAPAKNDDGPPGPRHYVTFGTFAPPASAEALRARLEAQGIHTVLETRLRVGPFATREEAQAAHTRLKELGFAPGAVLSPKR
jgi:DedD protein